MYWTTCIVVLRWYLILSLLHWVLLPVSTQVRCPEWKQWARRWVGVTGARYPGLQQVPVSHCNVCKAHGDDRTGPGGSTEKRVRSVAWALKPERY